MHSEGLMHCQGICATATSTEPTWGRELDNFLMSCMTVALEQNHPTWPLPPHIFIPTHFQALFLGSLHFCLTLCQPLLLWSYEFLFYGQQTFTFSSSTCLIWPTAASLFPSGRFLIKSVLFLNADKFPKVQFWSWYWGYPHSSHGFQKVLTPKKYNSKGIMWVGIVESPGSCSISATNYWFNFKQVTSPRWVTWGPFLSALNLSLLMRPFMYPEFVRCLHGHWAVERAHKKHVLNQWDQAIAASLYQQDPKLIWLFRLTVQQLSDLMTVEPHSPEHSCLSWTFSPDLHDNYRASWKDKEEEGKPWFEAFAISTA